jgi:hypothetical protein
VRGVAHQRCDLIDNAERGDFGTLLP